MRTLSACALVLLALCPRANASIPEPTVRTFTRADVVLFGTPVDARIKRKAPGWTYGETDLAILTVLRDHPALKDKKRVILPEYIDPTRKGAARYHLVTFSVRGGAINYQDRMACDGTGVVAYARKAMTLDPGSHPNDLLFGLIGREQYLREPDLRRAVYCYCLQSKGSSEASAHVWFMRDHHRAEVKNAEELLALEHAQANRSPRIRSWTKSDGVGGDGGGVGGLTTGREM